MATITDNITLDLSRENIIPPLQAKQYDTDSRFVHVQITNQGENFSVVSGNSVWLNIRRPDDTTQSFQGTRETDGTATLPLDSWALEVVGIAYGSVSIVRGDTRLTTLSFQIDVQEAESEQNITPEE